LEKAAVLYYALRGYAPAGVLGWQLGWQLICQLIRELTRQLPC
jgi:hypothetical protein